MENQAGTPGEAVSSVKVYLRGDEVRYVDWTREEGFRITRREYYFQRRILVSVTETIHSKGDRHIGQLKHPKFVSMNKFKLDQSDGERRGEFLQQARIILNDFRERRKEFHPCLPPHD